MGLVVNRCDYYLLSCDLIDLALGSSMAQITISDGFVSIVASSPLSALRIQIWAENYISTRGIILAIFVDEPEFPLEFWSKILL